MKLFNIGKATIDLDHVTAIYSTDGADPFHSEFFVRCDGKDFKVPRHPEGLVDDLFVAWESRQDVRNRLRLCKYHWYKPEDAHIGYFHQFYTDSDNEPCAIIETGTGEVVVPYTAHIKFIDNQT